MGTTLITKAIYSIAHTKQPRVAEFGGGLVVEPPPKDPKELYVYDKRVAQLTPDVFDET